MPRKKTQRTNVTATFEPHRIAYVGLYKDEALAMKKMWMRAGCSVTMTQARIGGSKLTDPVTWHYTVYAFGMPQHSLDWMADIGVKSAR